MMPSDQWFEDTYGVDVELTSIELRKQLEREETECQHVRRLIARERDRETDQLIDEIQCMGIELCDERHLREKLQDDYDALERRHSLTLLAFITMSCVCGVCLLLRLL